MANIPTTDDGNLFVVNNTIYSLLGFTWTPLAIKGLPPSVQYAFNMAFDPVNRKIYTSAADYNGQGWMIVVLDMDTLQEIGTIPNIVPNSRPYQFFQVILGNNANTLYVLDGNVTVKIVDIPSGTIIRTFTYTTVPNILLRRMLLSVDNTKLYLSDMNNNTVLELRLSDFTITNSLVIPQANLTALAEIALDPIANKLLTICYADNAHYSYGLIELNNNFSFSQFNLGVTTGWGFLGILYDKNNDGFILNQQTPGYGYRTDIINYKTQTYAIDIMKPAQQYLWGSNNQYPFGNTIYIDYTTGFYYQLSGNKIAIFKQV